MHIPEMPVYMPDNNLSVAAGSDVSVRKFQEWRCCDVTSVVGRRHESGMGSEVIGSVEKKALYCSHVVKTEQ